MILLLSLLTTASATTVCPSGACDYQSLQLAVEDAVDGDVIDVDDGSYTVHLDVQNNIHIRAMSGASPLLVTSAIDLLNGDQAMIEVNAPGQLILDGMILSALNGRPLRVDGGALTLLNSYVRAFTVNGDGGALWASNSVIQIENVTFDGNIAGARGGHIFATDGTVINIHADTIFIDGRANGAGGAIYMEGPKGSLFLNGAVFEGNRSFVRGGAIALDSDAEMTIFDGIFTDNRSKDGGAISFYGIDLTPNYNHVIRGVNFRGNQADASGGAVWMAIADVTFIDNIFSENTARDGGAISAISVTKPILTRNDFCGNTADPGRGGAIEFASDFPNTFSEMAWSNNLFVDNNSVSGAGAITINQPNVVLRNNHFLGNTTGVKQGSAVTVAREHVLFENNLFAFHDDEAVTIEFNEFLPDDRAEITFAYNAWFDNDIDYSQGLLTPTSVQGDPILKRYSDDGNCTNDVLHHSFWGSLRDAGDPALVDLDGSRVDIGAFGGELSNVAPWLDRDSDGSPNLFDCNETNPAIGTSLEEIWYDGVDTNCDLASDYDQDGDGYDIVAGPDDSFEGGTDCDDEDPNVHPGAVDIAHDGFDQDCTDGDETDGDKDGFQGSASGGNDCDDSDALVYPGATETDHDNIDSNCDGFDDQLLALVERRTCATTSAPVGGWLLPMALVLLYRRRQTEA